MPTRIEKLGELYDKAIERITRRTNGKYDYTDLPVIKLEHDMDMQVIQTYLQETKRPEREPKRDYAPKLKLVGRDIFTELEDGLYKWSDSGNIWFKMP